jgi:hypothetical protein
VLECINWAGRNPLTALKKLFKAFTLNVSFY